MGWYSVALPATILSADGSGHFMLSADVAIDINIAAIPKLLIKVVTATSRYFN